MRLLKLLLAGIVVAVAMIAGLLAIAVIAASALALVGARRLRRRGGVVPAGSSKFTEGAAVSARDEVIEVTATELPAGPPAQ